MAGFGRGFRFESRTRPMLRCLVAEENGRQMSTGIARLTVSEDDPVVLLDL